MKNVSEVLKVDVYDYAGNHDEEITVFRSAREAAKDCVERIGSEKGKYLWTYCVNNSVDADCSSCEIDGERYYYCYIDNEHSDNFVRYCDIEDSFFNKTKEEKIEAIYEMLLE